MPPPPNPLSDAHWWALDRIREWTFLRSSNLLAGPDPLDDIVQSVLAAQTAAVAQTDTYLATGASVAYDAPFTPIGLDPDPLIGVRARHGTSLEEAYGRVLKAGREDGMQRAVQLLRQNITTDVGLAQRNAAHAGMQARRDITGWRRKLNPAGGNVCGMCVAASTRVYRKQDLQPIHRMCRCTPEPVYDSAFTTTDVIDQDRLAAVYAASGGATDYETLSKIRINAADLPPGVDSDALDALNVRVVRDRELGLMLDADRHDTHFAISA